MFVISLEYTASVNFKWFYAMIKLKFKTLLSREFFFLFFLPSFHLFVPFCLLLFSHLLYYNWKVFVTRTIFLQYIWIVLTTMKTALLKRSPLEHTLIHYKTRIQFSYSNNFKCCIALPWRNTTWMPKGITIWYTLEVNTDILAHSYVSTKDE